MADNKQQTESVFDKLLKKDGDPQARHDLFASIEKILDDDVALGFVSSKVNGMSNEKIRGIGKPLIAVLKSRGVEIFSAGDENRAAKITNGFETVNNYAAIFLEFLPVLKGIYDYIKEGSKKNLGDNDWDDMMFQTQAQQQAAQQQAVKQQQTQQQAQQQRVNPNSITPPGQGQAGQRAYAGTGSQPQPPPKREGLTVASMLENYASKFGPKGLDAVAGEFQQKGVKLDVEFQDPDYAGKQAEIMRTGTGPKSSGGGGLGGMTMRSIAARHRAKFGDSGMDTVIEDIERAGLNTDGLGEGQMPRRRQAYDDDDDGDYEQPKPKAKRKDSRPAMFEDDEDEEVQPEDGSQDEEEYEDDGGDNVEEDSGQEQDEDEEYVPARVPKPKTQQPQHKPRRFNRPVAEVVEVMPADDEPKPKPKTIVNTKTIVPKDAVPKMEDEPPPVGGLNDCDTGFRKAKNKVRNRLNDLPRPSANQYGEED